MVSGVHLNSGVAIQAGATGSSNGQVINFRDVAIGYLDNGIYRVSRELKSSRALTAYLASPDAAAFWEHFSTEYKNLESDKQSVMCDVVEHLRNHLNARSFVSLVTETFGEPGFDNHRRAVLSILMAYKGDICQEAVNDGKPDFLSVVAKHQATYFDNPDRKRSVVACIVLKLGTIEDPFLREQLEAALGVVDTDAKQVYDELVLMMQDLGVENRCGDRIKIFDKRVRMARFLTPPMVQNPIVPGKKSLVDTLFSYIYSEEGSLPIRTDMALLVMHICERLGDSLKFLAKNQSLVTHANVLVGLFAYGGVPIERLIVSSISPNFGTSSRVNATSTVFLDSAFLLKADDLPILMRLDGRPFGSICDITGNHLNAIHMALFGFRTLVTETPDRVQHLINRLQKTISTLCHLAYASGEPSDSIRDLAILVPNQAYTFDTVLSHIMSDDKLRPYELQITNAVQVPYLDPPINIEPIPIGDILNWSEDCLEEIDLNLVESKRISDAIDDHLSMYPNIVSGESAKLINLIFDSDMLDGLVASGTNSPLLNRLNGLKKLVFETSDHDNSVPVDWVFPEAYPWSQVAVFDFLSNTQIPASQNLVYFPALAGAFVGIRSQHGTVYRIESNRIVRLDDGHDEWQVAQMAVGHRFVLGPDGSPERSAFLETVRVLDSNQYDAFNRANGIGMIALDPDRFKRPPDASVSIGIDSVYTSSPFIVSNNTTLPIINGTLETCWIEPLLNQEAWTLFGNNADNHALPYIYRLAKLVVEKNEKNGDNDSWVHFFHSYIATLDLIVKQTQRTVDIAKLAVQYTKLTEGKQVYRDGLSIFATGFKDTQELICTLSDVANRLIGLSDPLSIATIRISDSPDLNSVSIKHGLWATLTRQEDHPCNQIVTINSAEFFDGGISHSEVGFVGEFSVPTGTSPSKFPLEILIDFSKDLNFRTTSFKYLRHHNGHIILFWHGVAYFVYAAHRIHQSHWTAVFIKSCSFDDQPEPLIKYNNGVNAASIIDMDWHSALVKYLADGDRGFLRCRRCPDPLPIPESLKTAADPIREAFDNGVAYL